MYFVVFYCVGWLMFVVCCLLFVYCLLFAACLLSIDDCWLVDVSCVLFVVVCCLLFVETNLVFGVC